MEENKELMEVEETEDLNVYEWDDTEIEDEDDGSVALGASLLVGAGALIGVGASWVYRKLKPKAQAAIAKRKNKKSKDTEDNVIDIEAVEVDKKKK